MDEKRYNPVLFGRYFLTALLGSGAASRVYRGFPVDGDERLALKVLHPEHHDSECLRESLEREEQVGAVLGVYPNLLVARTLESIGGQYALILPHVDGWTLDVLLACLRTHDLRWPPKAVIDLLTQICRGLHAAHTMKIDGVDQGLVHRDLKPANIFVGRDGIVRVLDFGIARFRDRVGEKTRSGIVRGTPRYLSPEQARGEYTDFRADLFALGSVLYEMVMGEPAFELPPLREGQDRGDPVRLQELMRSIVFIDPEGTDREKTEALDARIPGMGAVLRWCWARDPNDRPASAWALELEVGVIGSFLRDRDGSLAHWLGASADRLPPAVEDGDFGSFGPPPSVEPEDHQTSIFLPALSPSVAALPEPSGVRFGRFRLLGLLGDGSQARVFLALTKEGERIALKVLHPDLTDEPHARAALEDEGTIGAALLRRPSPHVARVWPMEQVGAHFCLPMEYVDGLTLEGILYRREVGKDLERGVSRWGDRGLPLSAVVEIGIQICRGLAHAHRLDLDGSALHLVHRDLKPGNIMVGRDGIVRVLDFGIAKFDQALRSGAPTRDGTARGTPAYMSPEQASGKPLDARSDIFSLGSILYELLTGSPAFPQTGAPEAMLAILQGDPEVTKQNVSRVAPELADIVAGCHARAPHERWQRLSEVFSRLEQVRDLASQPFDLKSWLALLSSRLPAPQVENFWGREGRPEPVDETDRETRIFRVITPGETAALRASLDGSPVEDLFDVDFGEEDPDAQPTVLESALSVGHKVVVIQPLLPDTREFRVRSGEEDRDGVEPLDRKFRMMLWLVAALLLPGMLIWWLVFRETSTSEDENTAPPVLEPAVNVGTPEVMEESLELPPLSSFGTSPGNSSGTPPAMVTPAPAQLQHRSGTDPDPDPEPMQEPSVTVIPSLPEFAMLSVLTEPQARVFLDGEDIGKTPITSWQIPVGEHALRLECLACATPMSRDLSFTAVKDEHVHRVLNFAP